MTRLTYVHYSNPAAYPPLLHSSRILAECGWQIEVLGSTTEGADTLSLPAESKIRVQLMPPAHTRWGRRVHFARFTSWVVSNVVRSRPEWIYASDVFAAPAALVIKRLGLARVLYHEHDSPSADGKSSWWMQRVFAARKALARRADLCVLPQAERAEVFVQETGREGPTLTVWNCPSTHEVATPARPLGPPFVLYYHGNLSEKLLPYSLLLALRKMPDSIRLRAVGYETVGSRGFSEAYLREAERLGVHGRVEVFGPMDRHELMQASRDAHIGLALMPMESDDLNMKAMAGASNKPFDYLANGLALLVTGQPDWRKMYVEPGYGLDCDPRSPESIASAIRQLIASPECLLAMGEAGRQRILDDWNYERQFEPVLNYMMNDPCD